MGHKFGSRTEAFFGGRGGNFPYAHTDYYHLNAWITMIFGRKEFWVFATEKSEYMYPEPPDNWRSRVTNIFEPDYDKFPLFRKVKPTRFELGPGETLFIPAGTWHSARSLNLTMSVAFDQLNAKNMPAFTRDILSYSTLPLSRRIATRPTSRCWVRSRPCSRDRRSAVSAPVSSSTERERSPKRAFLSEIHSFRAVAIIAVVMTHVVDLLAWPLPPSLTERLIYSVAGNGTVLFLFVAGFLFQHLSARFNYGDYLRGKLRNVIIPYLVISLPIIAYQYLRRKGDLRRRAPGRSRWRALARGQGAGAGDPPGGPVRVHPPDRRPLPGRAAVAVHRSPPARLLVDRAIAGAVDVCAPALPLRVSSASRWSTSSPPTWSGCASPTIAGAPWRWYASGAGPGRAQPGAAGDRGSGAWAAAAPSSSDRIFSTEAGVVDLNLPIKLLASVLLVHLLSRPRVDARVRRKLDYLAGASFGVFFVHRPLIALVLELCRRFSHQEIAGGLGSLLVISAVVTALSLLVVAGVRALAGKRSRTIVGC